MKIESSASQTNFTQNSSSAKKFYRTISICYTVVISIWALLVDPGFWNVIGQSFAVKVFSYLVSVFGVRTNVQQAFQEWNFSWPSELAMFFLSPGLWIGLWIGYARVNSFKTIFLALIPLIICQVAIVIFFLLPGGYLIVFLISQWNIATIPYVLFGALVGYLSSKNKSIRANVKRWAPGFGIRIWRKKEKR